MWFQETLLTLKELVILIASIRFCCFASWILCFSSLSAPSSTTFSSFFVPHLGGVWKTPFSFSQFELTSSWEKAPFFDAPGFLLWISCHSSLLEPIRKQYMWNVIPTAQSSPKQSVVFDWASAITFLKYYLTQFPLHIPESLGSQFKIFLLIKISLGNGEGHENA